MIQRADLVKFITRYPRELEGKRVDIVAIIHLLVGDDENNRV